MAADGGFATVIAGLNRPPKDPRHADALDVTAAFGLVLTTINNARYTYAFGVKHLEEVGELLDGMDREDLDALRDAIQCKERLLDRDNRKTLEEDFSQIDRETLVEVQRSGTWPHRLASISTSPRSRARNRSCRC